MVTASLLALALSTSGLRFAKFVGPAHQEWGPPPPVAPYVTQPLPSSRAVRPMIFPLIGNVRMTSGFNDDRGTHRHTGMDIVAPKMTPIVAPFSGTIGFKRESFWIWADDGWGVLGTHLNDDNLGSNDHRGTRDVMFAPDLVPGQRVEAGRFIGYVGESGGASGPHLHFELYAPGGMRPGGKTRGLLRDPAPSLHTAQRLGAPRPSLPAAYDRPETNQLRLQGCVRKIVRPFDMTPGTLTLLLTAKQDSAGKVATITRVRYLKVRVTDAVIAEIGGWDALARAPKTLSVGVYIDANAAAENAMAERISSAPYSLR